MVLVCLPSDALLQHLPSYLAFSYLGRGVSLHGCCSKAQLLPFTLDEGYLLTATPPDLKRGVAPLGPPAPAQQPLLGGGVAPLGRCPWPRACGSSSQPPPMPLEVGKLLSAATPALSQPGALCRYPWPWARDSSSQSGFCATRCSRGASSSDSLQSHGLHNPWNFPGSNTGVGSFSLPQGIFPTQLSNPGLPHCRRILYLLRNKGSPTSIWQAY